MWNFRWLSDRASKSRISWATAVLLLRASAMAVILLLVIASYSKPPHDTGSAGTGMRTENIAHAVSNQQALCGQRYAAWASDEGAVRRADAILDCIESEP